MDALEAIMGRRSIRQYTGEPVSDEDVETLLRAAMAAPSAHNGQPWRFVVVRDRAQLERLAVCTPFARSLATADVGIVVCTEKKIGPYAGFWVIDCAAAIENLLVAAHALGLGALWMGVHPIAPFGAAVRGVIGAPRGIAVHSMVAVGRPAKDKPPAERYDEAFVHRERW